MKIRLGVILLVILFLVGSMPNYASPIHYNPANPDNGVKEPSRQDGTINPEYALSEHQQTGIIDALEIEQKGYVSTGNISVRNDRAPIIEDSLPIDTSTSWVASLASAEITELERLYVVNGTYDNGFPGVNVFPNGTVDYYPLGWSSNSTDTAVYTDDVQQSSYYLSSEKYVKVENKGGKVGQDRYGHVAGTRAVWTQLVENIPYTEDFILNLDYLYLRGPLDGPTGDPITGNCSLSLFIDGDVVWNKSLLLLPQREVWYNTGNIPIHISGAPSSFVFEIGLRVDEDLTPKYAGSGYDYDGDGYGDGVDNAAYITLFMDDVSFTALTPPTPESVELIFNAGAGASAVTGLSGSGTAEISNSSYWASSTLDLSFTSNASVSFKYNAFLLSHRFSNSNWKTEVANDGTAFIVNPGTTIQLDAFTYLGSAAEYSNNSLTIRYPSDWENVSIYDPFLTNTTASCSIGFGYAIIPDSLFSRLGWWQFTAESPNYAKDFVTQLSGSGAIDWANESIFRSTNYTRVALEIASDSERPTVLYDVEISWYMPNGTLWFNEMVDSLSGNTVNSSPLSLSSDNTTAGLWTVVMFWENGTELAFEEKEFEIHHQAELIAENVLIESESGSLITNMVRYKDTETNEYIMDTGTNIVANWSISTIVFQPNPVHNWWEGNFDTSIFGGGEYLVQVNASTTYYDSAECTFVIRSILTDNAVNLAVSSAQVNLLETYSAYFSFKDRYDTGIENGIATISYDGSAGGISWDDVEDLESGNYRVNFTASTSGSYKISITMNGTYYESAKDILLLDVGTLAATLSSENGTVADIAYGQSFRLVLKYTNGTGYGISGADVFIINKVPEIGLSNSSIEDLGDGFYSVTLTPTSANTFTVLFEAAKPNFDRELLTFTISVTDVPTILTVDSSDELIAIDEYSNVTLFYSNSTGVGIDGATFIILAPPTGLSYSDFEPLGNGYYRIQITPIDEGEYQLRFRASADNHLDSTAAVTLSVSLIRTRLSIEFPLAEYSVPYQDTLEVSFIFQRLDQSGIPIANISDATIIAIIPEESGLFWDIIPEAIHHGHYVLRLWGEFVGSWDVIIQANKTNHIDTHLDLIFSIDEIVTTVNNFESTDCFYNVSYVFNFDYSFETNESLILGANLRLSGSGSEFVTWEEGSSGYIVRLKPTDLGTYSITIEFTKDGHEAQYSTLNIEVNRVPLSISTDLLVLWDQFASLELSLFLTVTESGSPITDASVLATLYSGTASVGEFLLYHIGSGTYSNLIAADFWEDSDMTIVVSIQKQYHIAEDVEIQVITTPATIATLILRNSVPISGLLALVIGSVVSVQYSRRRQLRIRKEALEIKSSFDDANNLLGILILHKNSGLPFYSKILKGGFEEGMLSAFVTAVTHFRSEFESNGAEKEWKLTPISDIIRAGPTRNLICAFVTMTSPSLVHEAKMLMFTREIGLLLDDRMEVPPTEFRDDATGEIIEEMFDDHLDGVLLKEYRFSVEGALPRRYKKIADARSAAGLGDTFSLTELNRGLEALGVEEAKGFKLLFDAVNDGQLWPIDKDDELTGFSI